MLELGFGLTALGFFALLVDSQLEAGSSLVLHDRVERIGLLANCAVAGADGRGGPESAPSQGK